jgi:hypothetical protein
MSTTDPYAVNSTTRHCCRGIGRHTLECPEVSGVPLPAGADFGDVWGLHIRQGAYRVVTGPNRGVTDSDDAALWISGIQFWDGSIDGDGVIETPAVHVEGGRLNSDQARELAAALLEAAAVRDGWAD